MPAEFLVFQRFRDDAVANNMADILKQNNIEVLVSDNHKFLDAGYANSGMNVDISIQLKARDFARARTVLENFYKNTLDTVESDYYLFEFTDQELVEIVTRPDEWGFFDYELAQKILKDRGKEISPDVAGLLRKQRQKDLTKPEPVHRYIIYLGYISAALGGVLGIIIGWSITYYKKTLPDGYRVYAYRQEDRDHGTRMVLISAISIAAWTVAKLLWDNS